MDDEFEPKSQTKAEAELDRLRDWLRKSHWNFSLGRNSFDGFSEGVCVLGGIEPQGGNADSSEYGPRFLPGGLYQYWRRSTPPRHDEGWQLQYSVQEILDDYRALGLTGRQPTQKAILAAHSAGLTIPWLKVANEDLECARQLPPRLRMNDEIRSQIRHQASVDAGRERGNKDVKTSFLRVHVKPIFDLLAKDGFKAVPRANHGRSPFSTEIADEIYHEITGNRELRAGEARDYKRLIDGARKYLAKYPEALPDPRAFDDNIRLWRKALKKSGEQEKQ